MSVFARRRRTFDASVPVQENASDLFDLPMKVNCPLATRGCNLQQVGVGDGSLFEHALKKSRPVHFEPACSHFLALRLLPCD